MPIASKPAPRRCVTSPRTVLPLLVISANSIELPASSLAYSIPIPIRPTEIIEDLVGLIDVVLVPPDVGIVGSRPPPGSQRAHCGYPCPCSTSSIIVSLSMLCATAWRNALFSNHFSFSGADVGFARLRVRSGIHVQGEERRPEGRPSPVDREVLLVPGAARVARTPRPTRRGTSDSPRPERGQLGIQVGNDGLDDRIEVGQAVPLIVPSASSSGCAGTRCAPPGRIVRW